MNLQHASVDPEEVAYYSRLADTWWDTAGPFWPLHRLNALRSDYIRRVLCEAFDRDAGAPQPLEGLTLLDVGCGGGILSEAMAKLGASVDGIDVVERNIVVAEHHAEGAGLPLRYELVTAEALAERGARYDAVLNMEVVEHVADLPGFMQACCALVKPAGLMFIATINRTLLSYAFAIVGAEYVLRWLPRGTHHRRQGEPAQPPFLTDAEHGGQLHAGRPARERRPLIEDCAASAPWGGASGSTGVRRTRSDAGGCGASEA